MGYARIDVRVNRQGLRHKTSEMLYDHNTKEEIGKLAKDLMEPYVPKSSGQLRQSANVRYAFNGQIRIDYDPSGPGSADYPEKSGHYGRYIYEGAAMSPWAKSKTGKFYTPTENRQLNGELIKYHTPGTIPHWDDVLRRGGEKYDEFTRKAKEILKRAAKNNGG